MSVMDKAQAVLDDLKSCFGNKLLLYLQLYLQLYLLLYLLLYPSDIAPIIATFPEVQANLRSRGRFPISAK